MVSLYGKFTRLLELEVESLHDELEMMLDTLDERCANHEITDYVRNENSAVLRNELMGLEDFLRARLGPAGESADKTSLEEIAEEAREFLRARMRARDYVPALYDLVSRRIDKIVSYLRLPGAS